MIRQGHVATLEALLDREGVGHARFSEITGEPTDTMIDAGLAVYQQEECDFAIGFGGGSALDAAKAIALMLANPEWEEGLLYTKPQSLKQGQLQPAFPVAEVLPPPEPVQRSRPMRS